ncbi:MAG: glycosyltransferase family 2 protein, partial [Veillonella parvula]|nr:glycosyltransferase family 2 protein [Veillonella parvula]
RPTWAFIKVYFLQGGILDGKMGFILSVNHYFYTMTKYVKFYYLLKSKGKL